MMMMMCKRLAQVPMLCVPIYNIKLAMMQKTPMFTTFSAHTKMAADKRGQIEVFARITTLLKNRSQLGLLLVGGAIAILKNMTSSMGRMTSHI